MEYMLISTESAADFAKREDPAAAPAYWGAWSSYCNTLAESGIMVSGAGLQSPETATIVRIRDGKRTLHDGPVRRGERNAGWLLWSLMCRTSEPALEWAARSPSSSYGSTEVRPVLTGMAQA